MNKAVVNVITGFLGAGKTTIITKLIAQLPDAGKVVWLKNEYGDTNVDSLLISESNVKVAEIMNGCLCCVLVGRLGNAIDEILANYSPERIIIESSGTAYPLPIVLELSKNHHVYLDSVLTVIDVLNFGGYHDLSHVASMQAQATDIYLLNKHELASEQQLDQVKDLVTEVDPKAAFIKTTAGFVDANLVLDVAFDHGKYAQLEQNPHNGHDHPDDVDVWEFKESAEIAAAKLDEILKEFKERGLIRVKGIIKNEGDLYFYNWVLGRSTVQILKASNENTPILVFMGQDMATWQPQLQQRLIS